MSYTLVVVDCQNDFISPNYSRESKMAFRRIENLIIQAKRDQAAILFVEYEGCGPTWKEIRYLVKDYEKKGFCRKSDEDGGEEVARSLKRRKWPMDKILFCGLYADMCVKQTAITTASILADSDVHLCRAACISSFCSDSPLFSSMHKSFVWARYDDRPKNLKLK